MDQIKTLYTGIVENLEGKESAEELEWLVRHRLAVPLHEQKQSEIELIIKRWSEKEASCLPKAVEEKKNSYSSDSFESDSSSGRSSNRVKSNTSGDETGSARSKVSLTQEGAVLPEDSENDGHKSVGMYSGSYSSNNSTNSDRDKIESDHVGDGQSFDCSESGKIPVTDRTSEKNIEQRNTFSENTDHGSQDVLATFLEVNDSSDQTLPQGNPSHLETQKSDGCNSMNVERSAMAVENVLERNLGEDWRGKYRKDDELFGMSTEEVQEEKWTDKRGEKKENELEESDKDTLKNRMGELQKDEGLKGERISSSDDKLSEKQAQVDTLSRTDFSTREATSSTRRNDGVKISSNGRKKMKQDLTSEGTAKSHSEAKTLPRNLERDFRSVESQDEEKNHRGSETGREEGRGRDVKTDMKVDEVNDNDGISFIPPSPILPQGVPKKDHLVSSPVSTPSSPSPSDIPEKLTGDVKGLKNGQSKCDADSTVLTKVTNLTSLSMWNDDTSVWNSEEDSPSDPSPLPESLTELQDLRKNIAMELLWVQQAIQSRKAYLRLKENLGSQTGD
ncbi:IQ domain-containing protein C [Holothuria leucospilota]|uniref:IQ domain-containing protein C n=1 Tax=Holothuria leucospilota TaxID=206669 RepID=A0A9Q1BDC6_HOLLE|nr:IQ domain-containing protein C [Holothuria leucospilota]